MGVTPSINIFWTVSFSSFPAFPRDQRQQFPAFRWGVGIDGRTSVVAACPQDPAWRAHAQQVYQSFAKLKPARLWIDDDFRAVLKADLHSPCFCDVCLDSMAQRTGGARRTRQELLQAILADPPNPARGAWLDFQRELMRDVAAGLADAVHEVSPKTQMGIMSGPVEFLFAEGRRWDEFLDALAEPAPIARPPAGPYLEGTPVQFADDFNATRMAQAVLPARATIAPEIENFPNTQFDKSARVTRLQMELCQLLGINEITISVFPHEDRFDLRYEKVWERMLAGAKPRLQAIADLGITREQLRGVGLAWHEDVCRHSRVAPEAGKPIFVYRQRPWDSALPLLGFATCYGHDRGDVTAMSAELPEAFTDEQVRQIFSRGVLLDARAADSMVRRGLGDLVGISGRADDARAVIETLDDPAFATHPGESMMVRANGIPWQFRLKPETRVISKLRGYRGEETGHGAFVSENALGGRVGVVPFDSQADGFLLGIVTNTLTSPTFLCFARQAQMLRLLDWLGRKPVPLFVPGAPNVFPLLIEQRDRLIVAVANLCSDPIESLTLRLAPRSFTVRRVRSLSPSGGWQKCAAKLARSSDGAITVRTNLAVDHFEAAILELS